MNKNLNLSIDEVALSKRVYTALKNDELFYLRDVVKCTEAEMLRTPNFGRKSLNELKEVLADKGLHLGMDITLNCMWVAAESYPRIEDSENNIVCFYNKTQDAFVDDFSEATLFKSKEEALSNFEEDELVFAIKLEWSIPDGE